MHSQVRLPHRFPGIHNLNRDIFPLQDYFYKSPKGTRLFQLDLGELTLAFIGGQDHRMLDELEAAHKGEAGYEYVKDILDAKHIDYKNYLEE